MTELVFCAECKHRLYMSFYPDECRANPAPVDDWLCHHTILRKCMQKNARMNCPDFEAYQSLWDRFKQWLSHWS